MNLNEKKAIVEDLHDKFLRSAIVVVTDYKGLNVEAMNDLRGKLRSSEAEYRVVKNSLLVRASEDSDAAVVKDSFKGPTAIALSYHDPVGPAKVLTEFLKDNDKFKIKAAVMNGRLLDLNDIKALSSLPSREALLGQLLSVMNGVPTSFVRALSDIPRRFLNVLNAIKDQKEAA
jgi:large subunit ribosomal protein L10